MFFSYVIEDSLAQSLMAIKTISLSNLDLPGHQKVNDIVSNNEYSSKFGRRFCNLDYKYIVYITHDNYMNNVDRFILEEKGKKIIFSYVQNGLKCEQMV